MKQSVKIGLWPERPESFAAFVAARISEDFNINVEVYRSNCERVDFDNNELAEEIGMWIFCAAEDEFSAVKTAEKYDLGGE